MDRLDLVDRKRRYAFVSMATSIFWAVPFVIGLVTIKSSDLPIEVVPYRQDLVLVFSIAVFVTVFGIIVGAMTLNTNLLTQRLWLWIDWGLQGGLATSLMVNGIILNSQKTMT